jgi:hypothetical protein
VERKPANAIVKLANAKRPCGSTITESDNVSRQSVARRILTKTHQATNRNPIEADTAGELAADSETEPEKLVQVDGELGWGQITCFKTLAS